MVTQKKPASPTAGVHKPVSGVFEQLKKLEADQEKLTAARAQLLTGAKEELLAQGKDLIHQFAALGFRYELVDRAAAKKSHQAPVKGKGMRQTPEGKACPVCGFATEPMHDARTHRHLKHKKPFTAAELEERGLTRV